MRASVGPTAESLGAQAIAYGAAMQTDTAKRHLSPLQFHSLPVEVTTPTIDNGWLGPLGSYGNPTPSGSLYGYGVNADVSYAF